MEGLDLRASSGAAELTLDGRAHAMMLRKLQQRWGPPGELEQAVCDGDSARAGDLDDPNRRGPTAEGSVGTREGGSRIPPQAVATDLAGSTRLECHARERTKGASLV